MRSRYFAAVLMCALTTCLGAQTASLSWGGGDRGLRLGIRATTGPDRQIAFEVVTENTGPDDFVLRFGAMLANGKVMWPQAITLELIDPAGAVTPLQFIDRRYGVVAGRLDDFLVSLRAGSRYSILTSLDDYPDPQAGRPRRLAPGIYKVRAVLDGRRALSLNLDTQGIGLMNFWQGVATSGTAEFQVPR